MLTFFPRERMFSALYLSLPGGQGVCILYARVVFALSATKKRSYFCRDSDLPSYRFKCLLRAACVSLLMMMQRKNETHVQTNVQTNRRSVFYRA